MRTPNPFQTCPDCGAPPRIAHHETCRWSYTNMRSKLGASTEEALMSEVPQPEPEPDDDNGDDGDEGAADDQ